VLSTFPRQGIRNATSLFPMTTAERGGGSRRFDCDELTAPNASHDVSCATYPESGDGNMRPPTGFSRGGVPLARRHRPHLPLCGVRNEQRMAGAHWSRHVRRCPACPAARVVYVAADPSRKGRYAVFDPVVRPNKMSKS